MIIKIVSGHSGTTALIEASGRVFHETIAINDSQLDELGSHSTAALKEIGLGWGAISRLDFFGDEERDTDWRHEDDDGKTGVSGWTYHIVWWENRTGLFDVAVVDGSVYIMSNDGQTVEARR